MDIRIFPPDEMIDAEIALPLSKSISNRALVMNALTPGAAPLRDIADCNDTKVIVAALSAPAQGEKNVGPAGTAMRFLTAYYACTPGADVLVCGNERMHRRPIAPLVDALRACGAEIEYAGEEGYPPLRIHGRRLYGGEVEVDATVSSQFISALLIVAPAMDSPLTLVLRGEPASKPYLMMTIKMMRQRGIDVELDGDNVKVGAGSYKPTDVSVERDWSAASYWYSIQALSAGFISLPGLMLPSLQGDSACTTLFEKLGVITGDIEDEDGNKKEEGIGLTASPETYSRLDADLADTPDIVQTLVVACCMLRVPFRFTGVTTLRIKETDRLDALRIEMLKLGFLLNVENNGVVGWEGRQLPIRELPEIETYDDHRMAMAFAPAALYVPGMVVKDADVVSKSYPGFWEDLEKAGFRLVDASLPFETEIEE